MRWQRMQSLQVRRSWTLVGKFLVRGNAVKTYESGVMQRVVVIEFDSVDKAVAVYDSEGYQAALKLLGGGAVRDIRIVEGVA
jgi:uncharacterized protein (DUF1330 family)